MVAGAVHGTDEEVKHLKIENSVVYGNIQNQRRQFT
jgi:hypothetical protein